MTITIGAAVLALAMATPAMATPSRPGFGRATLTGFAALPAATFVPASEPSGARSDRPVNGVTPPFADQPVQGFSGIVRRGDGTFEVLSDNGYGAKNNSADFLLRINRITRPSSPAPSTCSAGSTSPTRTATCRCR